MINFRVKRKNILKSRGWKTLFKTPLFVFITIAVVKHQTRLRKTNSQPSVSSFPSYSLSMSEPQPQPVPAAVEQPHFEGLYPAVDQNPVATVSLTLELILETYCY